MWRSRYGYIITRDEPVVVRVSKESIDPGLAAFRSIRDISHEAARQASHSRTRSTETNLSEMQTMSLDTGSSSCDDANPNVEHGPLFHGALREMMFQRSRGDHGGYTYGSGAKFPFKTTMLLLRQGAPRARRHQFRKKSFSRILRKTRELQRTRTKVLVRRTRKNDGTIFCAGGFGNQSSTP